MRRAIVFVHGFMGTPNQFASLINTMRLDNAIDRYNVVLPGHCGTITDFTKSHPNEWQSYVNNLLTELRMKYDDLILIGHSMGGLLLINAAVDCSKKISAIYAISMPLYIKVTIKGLYIRIKSLYSNSDCSNNYILAAYEMNGVSGVTF